MQKLRIRLTEADILNAQRFKISNLTLYALQNATGTLWRLNESGLALETMSPFRVALLPNGVIHDWNKETENKVSLPYECDIETFCLPIKNSELLRHFHTLNGKKSEINSKNKDSLCSSNDNPATAVFLAALQRDGWVKLQVVCSQIIIEAMPPYRTFVLRRETLQAVNDWLTPLVFEGNPEAGMYIKPQIHILLELHTPLESEAVQHIMIKLDHNL